MHDTGFYEIDSFPKNRDIIIDALKMSKYYNHIVGIMEVDVTKALKVFEDFKEENGERLSFTAWIMKCIAKAASEHKVIQTFRYKRRKTVIFDDVDIKCMVERKIKGRNVPIHYIFRKVDKKSFSELHEEMRQVQKKVEERRAAEKKVKKRQKFLMRIPKFIRQKLIWGNVMKNPFKVKKHLGTIGVSAIGMFGKGMRGWAIPMTPHQTQFMVGAIVKKPIYIDEDNWEFRDILNMVVSLNHDTVDGGPAVRFAKTLTELMENAFGLDELKEKK